MLCNAAAILQQLNMAGLASGARGHYESLVHERQWTRDHVGPSIGPRTTISSGPANILLLWPQPRWTMINA